MAAVVYGYTSWSMNRDRDGYRTYKLKNRVHALPIDGPLQVLYALGLPQPGETWQLGDEYDSWAFCTQDAVVTPVVTGEPNTEWDVEQTFTSKPDELRCKREQTQDPLLIPDRISGSFTKYTEEERFDRFGYPIQNSAFEPFKGHHVEFDHSRPTVTIDQNRATLELSLMVAMQDTLNATPLWGLPPRCIKFNCRKWSRKFYGACFLYYERTLEFEMNYKSFDRALLDEGTKALYGHFDKTSGLYVVDNIAGSPPNPFNPLHFIRWKDRKAENSSVILNGHGLPAGVATQYSNQYISLIANNQGNALTDPNSWLKMAKPTTPQNFDLTQYVYVQGSVVLFLGDTYIATGKPDNVALPTDDPAWTVLLNGLQQNKGAFDNTKLYNMWDIVFDPNSDQPGQIPVQYYGTSNFLLLGIPLALDTTTF
jgi:hypothetical protein